MRITRFIRRHPIRSTVIAVVLLPLFVALYFGAQSAQNYFRILTEAPEKNEFVAATENVSAIYTELAEEIERGDIDTIKRELETKAAATENMAERAMLLFTLAQTIIANDLPQGVAKYKELANDEALPPAFRASALISFAALYYGGTADPANLDAAVFSGETYADMKPVDNSPEAREDAYARLLVHAESIHQTMIANAYLSHYYAKRVFLYPEDITYRESAAARLYILDYHLENTPESPYDTSLHMAKILRGTSQLYLSATHLIDVTEDVTKIRDGFDGLTRTAEAALAEAAKLQGSNTAAQNASRAGFLHNQAILWDTVLGAAAAVAEQRPDIASKIGDMYAEFILSPQGTYERERAKATGSTSAAHITTLKTYSETLRNILESN